MKWLVKPEESGMTVHTFLREEKEFSRRILKAVKFDGGEILVNGREQTVRHILKSGDLIQVQFPKEKRGLIKPIFMPLDIVYEDDAILILNKQPGIATIPGMNHSTYTITNGVLAYYKEHAIPYTVHIVTRLDRDTSGLLLIAKHRYSHSILAKEMRKGTLQRYYQAIVTGKLSKEKGVIEAKIGRKKDSIIERQVRDDGQHAITKYQVSHHMGGLSLLELYLETGRTHQIRVHLAWMGHPIIGDQLYGGDMKKIKRQALHCFQLSFIHPISKKQMHFHAPLPEDMREAWR